MTGKRSEKPLAQRELNVAIANFRRAAWQRHEAATFLSSQRSYAMDAMYLEGYTVECGLKALLLCLTPPRRRNKVYGQISRGRSSHDLERLKQMLAESGCPVPNDVAKNFRRVMFWSTRLRYEVKRMETTVATEFLEAAEEIMNWVEGRATWPILN